MRVLFLAENLTYGGVAHRFIELANDLANRGMDVTLYVYNGEIQLIKKVNKSVKCITQALENNTGDWFYRNFIYRVKCIKNINIFLQSNKYDVIISFNDMVNINVLMSKVPEKCKVIISERSDPNYNKKYLQIVKKIIFNKADGIVFQTNGARDFFGKKIKVKSAIIPNPIPNNFNVQIYNGEREDIIVSVARLWIYQKRQDVLIKAFKEITKINDSIKLVLIGDGPDQKVLEELVEQLEIKNRVVFSGVSSQVLDDIKKAKMFVLSSDFEGIPNALIEAMACGLPVVSTDCSPGGARMLIDNGKNGLLVECGEPEKLAQAIKYMLEHPKKALEMGKCAVKIVDRFNAMKIYDEWEDYIKKVVRE